MSPTPKAMETFSTEEPAGSDAIPPVHFNPRELRRWSPGLNTVDCVLIAEWHGIVTEMARNNPFVSFKEALGCVDVRVPGKAPVPPHCPILVWRDVEILCKKALGIKVRTVPPSKRYPVDPRLRARKGVLGGLH